MVSFRLLVSVDTLTGFIQIFSDCVQGPTESWALIGSWLCVFHVVIIRNSGWEFCRACRSLWRAVRIRAVTTTASCELRAAAARTSLLQPQEPPVQQTCSFETHTLNSDVCEGLLTLKNKGWEENWNGKISRYFVWWYNINSETPNIDIIK